MAITQFVIANNVNTQLAAAASSSATTLTLASSANLPTLTTGQAMPLTLNDAATGQNYEIVYVTAITGVTLTVVRAQEGTGALTWNVGDYAFCPPTAGTVATALGNSSNTFSVAPATQSQHAIQAAQAAGVVGSVRNLVMSVTAASATATLTADEIIVETALGGVRYCLPSFSKTINLATTGAGGMDTGTAPVSGFVALYAIYNPATGASALLATNAATKQNNVYGGANMPAGYTASALVGVWPTSGSSQFVIGYQQDRSFYRPVVTALNTTTQVGSYTSVSISGAVPANAKTFSGELSLSNNTASTGNNAGIGSDANPIAYTPFSLYVATANGAGAVSFASVPLITAQTTFYYLNANSGTVTLTLGITGYSI